jgi:membrane protein implicated in regulation of membrane protease activity
MEHAYFIMFCVGVMYTVITFFLGGVLHIAHIGGHGDGSGGIISPLKPIAIVSFITVFGGTGIIGTHYKLNMVIIFILAFILAISISFSLYRFIIIPLTKAQNTSAVYQEEIIGMEATVISTIIENGFGTISYVVNGSKYNAPAQHVSKKSVKQGEKVMIYDIKNNIFYVEPLDD